MSDLRDDVAEAFARVNQLEREAEAYHAAISGLLGRLRDSGGLPLDGDPVILIPEHAAAIQRATEARG